MPLIDDLGIFSPPPRATPAPSKLQFLQDDLGILATPTQPPTAKSTPTAPPKLSLVDDAGILKPNKHVTREEVAARLPGEVAHAQQLITEENPVLRENIMTPRTEGISVPKIDPARAAHEGDTGVAVDPAYVMADVLTAGGASLGEGVLAALKTGAKAGAQSAIFQKAQDYAARKTGEAFPNHPYLQAAAGLVLPMLFDVGARRAARNVLPERIPEGTTLAESPEGTASIGAPAASKPEQPTGAAALRQSVLDAINPTSPPAGAAAKALTTSPGETMPGSSVFRIPRSKVEVKPEVYQHKIGANAETGGGLALTDVKKFDVGKSGVLTVHHTGEYGTDSSKYYMVNGHQRLDASDRLGVKEPLRYQVLDEGTSHPGAVAYGVTPETARSYGAVINLSEGRGTALDAAKFMRDSGVQNPAQMLEREGVSLTEKKAQDAVALSQLSPALFRDVTLGRFPEDRAAAIGREFGDNQPAQDAIYKRYRDLENSGEKFTDKKFAEWVKVEKGAGSFTDTQETLFGQQTEQKSYGPQMADVLSYAREQLGTEKRVFGSAEKNAERLAAGNTTVDKAQAMAIQQGAATRGDLLDKFAYSRGTAANAAARKYAEILANTPKAQRAGVLKDAYKDIYAALDDDYKRTFNAQNGLAGTNPTGGEGQRNLLAGRSEQPPTMGGADVAQQGPSAAEKEAAGQGNMFGGPMAGSTNLDFLTGGVAEKIAPYLKTYKQQITKAFAPTSLSETAGAGGALISRRNAEMENDFTLAVRSMDGARRYMDRLDRPQTVDFITKMENGRAQATPELDAVAATLRDVLDKQRDAVQRLGTGALDNFYENYFPHIWTDPKKAQEVYTSLRGSLEGSKSFLKRRTFDSFADGYNAGLQPVSWNPVELAMLKYYEMGKYIRGQKIFADLKKEGWTKFVKLGKDGPPGWTKINDKIARVNQWSETEKAFLHRGDYYAPEEISLLIDRHLSPGLKHGTGEGSGIYDLVRGVNNTMNQFQLGVSAFHIATTAMNSASSHMALALQKASRGEFREAARHAVTGLGGPAALIKDYMKGRKIYRQFYGMEDYGPEFQQTVKNYIDSGANFDQARPFIDNWTQSWQRAWREGRVAKGIALTPHVAVEQMARPIFEHIVPKAKAAAFMDLAQEELAKLPANARETDRLRVLSATQNSIDNRFGMLNYDKLFWDNKMKDLAFIGVRAVGWNVGDVREFGGGLTDLPKILTRREITPRAAYAIAMPLTAAIYGAAYQYAKTGHFPGFALKQTDGSFDTRQSMINFIAPETGRTLEDGRPERVWLPGYQKDIFGMATKPGETIFHKLSPLVSLGYDVVWSNEDYFHRQIRDTDASIPVQASQVAKFALSNTEPLTAQNLLRRSETTGSGGRSGIGIESAFGFSPATRDVTNSPMMNYIDEQQKARSPQGAIDQRHFERQQAMREIEQQLREYQLGGGKGKAPDLSEAIKTGQLSATDVHRALLTSRRPYLESRFSELPFDKAIKAYGIARQSGNVDEMKRVWPIIIQKLQRGGMKQIPQAAQAQVIAQLKRYDADQKALGPHTNKPTGAGLTDTSVAD